ncbi:uncharacterized protein VTP21DRAFT_9788 [Calcarisporiella thermophila]|uniref:uncharacterized protein n=1 Tax=Calcarisporiella thermophila TaxID=911321 RepID=UPI003742E2AF
MRSRQARSALSWGKMRDCHLDYCESLCHETRPTTCARFTQQSPHVDACLPSIFAGLRAIAEDACTIAKANKRPRGRASWESTSPT